MICIDDLRPGKCIKSILDHDVWAMAGDAFTLTADTRKSVEGFAQVGDRAYKVMECALVSNVGALRRLHSDLHWSPAQLEALAKSQVAEFGPLSDDAQKGMRAVIDSLRPLARVGLDNWHASVRVLLEMYGLNGPGALSTQQIAAVMDKAHQVTEEESPQMHAFVHALLKVP